MNAVDILRREHAVIGRLLMSFEHYLDALEDGTVSGSDLLDYVRVFLGYIREGHEAKEDRILYRAMYANGVPVDTGPTARMMAEHVEAGALLRELQSILAARGDATSPTHRERAVELCQEYLHMMRRHINAEETGVYPIAFQKLRVDLMEELGAGCADFDSEREKSGIKAELDAVIERLCKRFV